MECALLNVKAFFFLSFKCMIYKNKMLNRQQQNGNGAHHNETSQRSRHLFDDETLILSLFIRFVWIRFILEKANSGKSTI